MPLIKNRYGGILEIGEQTVINSDNENSNTPIPTLVKFVLGMNARIIVGRNCDLNGIAITAYKSVSIGDYVQIGAGGLISDTDLHPLDARLRRMQLSGGKYPIEAVAKADIVIEDDVWIGYGVIILKGVRIGRGSIIGAGSVVTGNIPPSSVAAGNPATVVRKLDED